MGSQALVRTASCGSLRPVDAVFCLLISRLSLISRFCRSDTLFLSVSVDMIFGDSHSMVPEVQWRACLEIPEMFSSALEEVVSAACCAMRVRKETRV